MYKETYPLFFPQLITASSTSSLTVQGKPVPELASGEPAELVEGAYPCAPRLRQLRVCGVPFFFCIIAPKLTL